MVILVSQCEKKALNRTRRVLDSFADRIGDNTWQTVITEDGLNAVKKLLRKTASKNTAVSCHWIRSRASSDLLWVVGNKNKFDHRGVVAVNRTKKNILQNNEANDWPCLSSIQIVSTIAALLHDIGKSTIGFQNKLREKQQYGDPYRHEWISLKLFSAMIAGCKADDEWLERFQHIDVWLDKSDFSSLLKKSNRDKVDIAAMPPIAQWVGWLIVSHHRLPPIKKVFYKSKEKERLKQKDESIKYSLATYYQRIFKAFDFWVKNPKTINEAKDQFLEDFWGFDALVIHSPEWQKNIKRWAKKAQQDITLKQLVAESENTCAEIINPFLLYLSRLSLMVGDHNYSSLDGDDKRRAIGSKSYIQLAANTDRKTKETKQALDEHLIGVASFTAKFSRNLPAISNSLPALVNQSTLSKNTNVDRFRWQNKSYKLATELQKESEDNGFFGINMASTGCGKTIGNARIMYGLADPKKGARFTIALGLRVLTLQTGQSFRDDLKLTKEQLAILVGGLANKKLFEMNRNSGSDEPGSIEDEVEQFVSNTLGSESSEDLLNEIVDSQIDYQDYEQLNLGTVIENPKARDLLYAPVVTCTVDHIIQASECRRGGKYIAPMLRLLSSDLILDEPDDFDQSDLPALSRLVHLAGLFGSRALLSSATLTPDLVAGLFIGYQEGRKVYNQIHNKPVPKVACAWFDENEKNITSELCLDIDSFSLKHQKFTDKREKFLAGQSVRRKAEILPLSLQYNKEKESLFYSGLAQTILNGAIGLHQNHHLIAPESKKHVSIGLVRIANIKNINRIAMRLFEDANVPDDVQIHLSCYHAKQLLVLRNSLENKLDRILKRDQNNPNAIFEHTEIKESLSKSDAKNHIFIVLATPVAEVGRDHDYDWAIVEPSSMRSIIQLAGRVCRHRPEKIAEKTNILILQNNIRYFTRRRDNPVFIRPGFESAQFKLTSYDSFDLIPDHQLQQIDARPRIVHSQKRDNQTEVSTLSELEHQVMRDVLNNQQLNYINAYWSHSATSNRLHTHLQQISEFRQRDKREEDWLLIPSKEDDKSVDPFYADDVSENSLLDATPHPQYIKQLPYNFGHSQITPWLVQSLNQALLALQEIETERSIRGLAVSYASVSLPENQNGWLFHEFFGFIQE